MSPIAGWNVEILQLEELILFIGKLGSLENHFGKFIENC
jgi:hypothetical protein